MYFFLLAPCTTKTLNLGAHLFNSSCHCNKHAEGATINVGPFSGHPMSEAGRESGCVAGKRLFGGEAAAAAAAVAAAAAAVTAATATFSAAKLFLRLFGVNSSAQS